MISLPPPQIVLVNSFFARLYRLMVPTAEPCRRKRLHVLLHESRFRAALVLEMREEARKSLRRR